jgi:hypothetical protein
MKIKLGALIMAASALAAGCGGDDEGRAGVTPEEDRQLNEVGKMLDDNMIDVSPDSLTANEAELEAIDANTSAANESPAGNAQ